MKVSTKGRYGIRLVLELALRYDAGIPVSLSEVASRQDISTKYLEQIATLLVRAHVIKSIRGAKGGYMLSAPPAEFTFGAVLRALEGSLSPLECLEDSTSCQKSDSCTVYKVWDKVKTAVEDVVDHITFQDLVNDYGSDTSRNPA